MLWQEEAKILAEVKRLTRESVQDKVFYHAKRIRWFEDRQNRVKRIDFLYSFPTSFDSCLCSLLACNMYVCITMYACEYVLESGRPLSNVHTVNKQLDIEASFFYSIRTKKFGRRYSATSTTPVPPIDFLALILIFYDKFVEFSIFWLDSNKILITPLYHATWTKRD